MLLVRTHPAHQVVQLGRAGAGAGHKGVTSCMPNLWNHPWLTLVLARTILTAQPLDKMEKAEIRKQAEKFVEPGFKLVAKEKVCVKQGLIGLGRSGCRSFTTQWRAGRIAVGGRAAAG